MHHQGESQLQIFLALVKKIIASIVYTHLWIAICAASMVLQTSYLLTSSWTLTPLVYLTFGSTLFIYAIHRLVGLQKLKNIQAILNPRYITIEKSQRTVLGFGTIGGFISAYFFFRLQMPTQLWLIIPGVISLAYVIPFLSGRKRLRDIGVIKIFLIAITYAIICVLLVYLEQGAAINQSTWILFGEKALFIFAITIPFDMRDLHIDQISQVDTLPMKLGWNRSKILAQSCLVTSIVLIWTNGLYVSLNLNIALTLAYLISIGYIQMINRSREDLYYSFGMDGLMILQALLVVIFCSII